MKKSVKCIPMNSHRKMKTCSFSLTALKTLLGSCQGKRDYEFSPIVPCSPVLLFPLSTIFFLQPRLLYSRIKTVSFFVKFLVFIFPDLQYPN